MRCPRCGLHFTVQPKQVKLISVDRADDVREVFKHYRSCGHPAAHLLPLSKSKEYKLIAQRLDEGFEVEHLCAAIDGMHRTPHNLGVNDRGQRYLSLALCMRDGSQVTRFMEAPMTPDAPMTRANQTTAMALMEREHERTGEHPLLVEAHIPLTEAVIKASVHDPHDAKWVSPGQMERRRLKP